MVQDSVWYPVRFLVLTYVNLQVGSVRYGTVLYINVPYARETAECVKRRTNVKPRSFAYSDIKLFLHGSDLDP